MRDVFFILTKKIRLVNYIINDYIKFYSIKNDSNRTYKRLHLISRRAMLREYVM